MLVLPFAFTNAQQPAQKMRIAVGFAFVHFRMHGNPHENACLAFWGNTQQCTCY